MRGLHFALMIFVQVLLASFVFYSTLTSASPIEPPRPAPAREPEVAKQHQAPSAPVAGSNVPPEVSQPKEVVHKYPVIDSVVSHEKDSPVVVKHKEQQPIVSVSSSPIAEPAVAKPVAVQAPVPIQPAINVPAKAQPVVEHVEPQQKSHAPKLAQEQSIVVPAPVVAPVVAAPAPVVEAPKADTAAQPVVVLDQLRKIVLPSQVQYDSQKVAESPVVAKQYHSSEKKSSLEEPGVVIKQHAPVEPAKQQVVSAQVFAIEHSLPVQAIVQQHMQASVKSPVSSPVVKGGLGPLHLLAATLCSYQPDRPFADETQSLLYSRRAAVRKSLFDFMSLKFTNLERLSSRLNGGLEVVPPKTHSDHSAGASAGAPSHGWPVVGNCTAHDLKLMAEASWCECTEESGCSKSIPASEASLDYQKPAITSNHHFLRAARSYDVQSAQTISPDKSAIISRILHVSDVKDAPVVESQIASLNLTQQQLASLAQVTSTRECRRNALRMTKALFNHLAEDQSVVSSSWPKLYSQMAADECARKRMIDIVSALSSYRTEASSIRRDNMEFAFAMDDLRTKVLESEVNVPLTFDKQFIEVGQFMQQSVKLMLTSIDPERARLTSMRYRSLMPGPTSFDDQCIELHQRLLAKNYPTSCNPTQFGQLPDVLRMAASSLELWSIESELSKYNQLAVNRPASQQQAEFQQPSACSYHQQTRHDLNECISNLVSY